MCVHIGSSNLSWCNTLQEARCSPGVITLVANLRRSLSGLGPGAADQTPRSRCARLCAGHVALQARPSPGTSPHAPQNSDAGAVTRSGHLAPSCTTAPSVTRLHKHVGISFQHLNLGEAEPHLSSLLLSSTAPRAPGMGERCSVLSGQSVSLVKG